MARTTKPDDQAATTSDTSRNTVTVEDAGPSRKKITIEVPADVVDQSLETSFDTLTEEAELPGFRRGRVPRRLVEKKFGTLVSDQAKSRLLAEAYTEAVEREKLQVLGEPREEDVDAGELVRGEPYRIAVTVEVMPQFELPSTDGITVRRPVVEIFDALVEAELAKLSVNEGELVERETSEPGDYLTGHGIMKGTPQGATAEQVFHDIKGCVVRIPPAGGDGSGMILGVVVPDMAAQFGLPGRNETVTIRTTGPESHEINEVRGTPLTVTFTVSDIHRIEPASEKLLLSRFGLPDADAMRRAIKNQLERRAENQARAAMREQVARHLAAATTVELPERLSADQADRIYHRRRLELTYRGVPDDQIERHIAELRASATETARVELKQLFILSKLAELLEIRVTEGEVNSHISQLAFQRGTRPEELRNQLVQNGQIAQIAQHIRDHKVLDRLIEGATIEDMPADEFDRTMREMNTVGT